jgi:H+/Cl- antiporter ClcA
LGIPVVLAAALGYASVFGSATNTLLAPMLIGGEVFGFNYLPYFLIVCGIAFMCNGNRSIYGNQKIG